MFKYKRKNAELSAENEKLRRDFNELRGVCQMLEAELARYREAEAAQNRPTPKPRVAKVPHCVACSYHARFNNAGKYAHQCNKVGRQIRGDDTRTSPSWCPLRTPKKDVEITVTTAMSTVKNTIEKGSVNHDDSTT